MEVREKQPLRAQFPMVVRLSGRVREVREELPENLKFADGTEPVGKGDRGEGGAVLGHQSTPEPTIIDDQSRIQPLSAYFPPRHTLSLHVGLLSMGEAVLDHV